MAAIDDLTASINGLAGVIAAADTKLTTPVTDDSAQLEALKAQVDSLTSQLNAALNPPAQS